MMAVSAAVPGSALALTSYADHATLTGQKGLGDVTLTTNWFGISKYGLSLKFNLGLSFGGTLAKVDLKGGGTVDTTQKLLWFNGGDSTALMNVGISTWAKYWVQGFGIDKTDNLPFIGDKTNFDWQFYDTKTISGQPYLLNTSLTLTDDLAVEDIIGKSIDIGSLEFRAALDLNSTANNKIEGRYLSTDRGTFYSTGTGDKKNVTMSTPAFTVGSIVQSSKSTWNMGVTPTATFSVTYSWWLNYKYSLPIYTFPFNLGSFTFQTSPGSMTICTGLYYPDSDNDGYAVSGTTTVACSKPLNYAARLGDCNDGSDTVYPGATEKPNGVDDNCDGVIDEGFQLFYADDDGDGYGDPADAKSGVPGEPPTGYVAQAGDCNDNNAGISPGALEVCQNTIDDNCNAQTDEGCNPPVAADMPVTTDEDTDAPIYLTASDLDGDALTFSIVEGPTHGSLTGTLPSPTYDPHANFNGSDSFTYRANDGRFDSNTATVTITVNPVNDPPVAHAGPDQELVVGSTCESITTLNGIQSSDVDGDPLTYSWTWDGGTAIGTNPEVAFHAGTTMIALRVSDGQAYSQPDTVLVTARDLTPAVVTPSSIVAECQGPDGQFVDVGTPTVTDNCCDPSTIVITSDAPLKYYLGSKKVIWSAIECHGNSSQGIQVVTIQDTLTPDLSVSVAPDILWPPNHSMIEAVPSISTGDLCCGQNVTVELLSVQMSEGDRENTFDPLYDFDPTVGYFGDDIQIIGGRIYLRAERSGNSSGRVYPITYRATDCASNVTSAMDMVVVPHDQR
jgi:hypothetical protein